MEAKEILLMELINNAELHDEESLGCIISNPEALLESLLSACYPCPECEGYGNTLAMHLAEDDIANVPCPTCNGTGEGNRMLAILSPDQTPPENHQWDKSEETFEAFNAGINWVINQGWRKEKEVLNESNSK